MSQQHTPISVHVLVPPQHIWAPTSKTLPTAYISHSKLKPMGTITGDIQIERSMTHIQLCVYINTYTHTYFSNHASLFSVVKVSFFTFSSVHRHHHALLLHSTPYTQEAPLRHKFSPYRKGFCPKYHNFTTAAIKNVILSVF